MNALDNRGEVFTMILYYRCCLFPAAESFESQYPPNPSAVGLSLMCFAKNLKRGLVLQQCSERKCALLIAASWDLLGAVGTV